MAIATSNQITVKRITLTVSEVEAESLLLLLCTVRGTGPKIKLIQGLASALVSVVGKPLLSPANYGFDGTIKVSGDFSNFKWAASPPAQVSQPGDVLRT